MWEIDMESVSEQGEGGGDWVVGIGWWGWELGGDCEAKGGGVGMVVQEEVVGWWTWWW
jgi:hypothetical protein